MQLVHVYFDHHIEHMTAWTVSVGDLHTVKVHFTIISFSLSGHVGSTNIQVYYMYTTSSLAKCLFRFSHLEFFSSQDEKNELDTWLANFIINTIFFSLINYKMRTTLE